MVVGPRLASIQAEVNMRWTTLAWMLLSACDPNKDGLDEGPSCEETPSEVALDEVTPLGFAASSVLARLPATETVPLIWATGEQTELSLAFRPADVAQYIDSEAVYPEGGTVPAIGIICDDYVQVAVQFDLATVDGAFDETFDGKLRASSEDGGEIRQELDLEGLTGTFDINAFTDTEDYDDRSAWVTITVGDLSTIGVIEGQVSGSEPCDEGDTCSAWAEQVDIASWGGVAI